MPNSVNVTPVAVNLPNAFDYLGMLAGLPRLPGEENVDFRRRIWDVYVHRAGSNQIGLINGITRELGLEQFDALRVSFTGDATNFPRVIVRDVQVELYSNWQTDGTYTLDATIDIYSAESSAYFLSGLVSEINALSLWSASLMSGIDSHQPATTLLQQDSRVWQEEEILRPFFLNKLEYGNLIKGTLNFSAEGLNVFAQEVDTLAEVGSPGTYWVDYRNGLVNSALLPTGDVFCRYMYDALPFDLAASPVVLHEFGSSFFRNKVFEQVLQSDGNYIEGLPLQDGIEYINELLNARGMYWGI